MTQCSRVRASSASGADAQARGRAAHPSVDAGSATFRAAVRCGRRQRCIVLTVSLDGLLDLGNHVLLSGDLETDLGEVEGVGDGTGNGCSDTLWCQRVVRAVRVCVCVLGDSPPSQKG